LVNLANNTDFEIQHEFSAWNSPFLLENESAYQHWKKTKLERLGRFNPKHSILPVLKLIS